MLVHIATSYQRKYLLPECKSGSINNQYAKLNIIGIKIKHYIQTILSIASTTNNKANTIMTF